MAVVVVVAVVAVVVVVAVVSVVAVGIILVSICLQPLFQFLWDQMLEEIVEIAAGNTCAVFV